MLPEHCRQAARRAQQKHRLRLGCNGASVSNVCQCLGKARCLRTCSSNGHRPFKEFRRHSSANRVLPPCLMPLMPLTRRPTTLPDTSSAAGGRDRRPAPVLAVGRSGHEHGARPGLDRNRAHGLADAPPPAIPLRRANRRTHQLRGWEVGGATSSCRTSSFSGGRTLTRSSESACRWAPGTLCRTASIS